ncbi:NTP transferase domain-containing protein [Rhodoferax sp. 4810]|uniref:NTP transferase domain-containing protein n=1 Tax=Thiospirillum jenense TaxID=1653858 RepID=A0A839HLM4_9GAMM|nr:NTP transferase domain-containing protein [Thiospirillum jenense]MBB1074568.1 NTP transferase domain-containing protein [Rhodoferax jenense]MBB1126542.1 NTP transferase domain-containing protein [Thiospirillum jenense]
MKIIILADGISTQLGLPQPKPLIPLVTGASLLQHQLEQLRRCVNIDDVIMVVGFKKELIMETWPELLFLYNDLFATTNSAYSLMTALRKTGQEDVLIIEGDVVFPADVISLLLTQPHSAIAAMAVSANEKCQGYSTDAQGAVRTLIQPAPVLKGIAPGITRLLGQDVPKVREALLRCEPDATSEEGFEYAIERGLRLYPVPVYPLYCLKIALLKDLRRINAFLSETRQLN